MNITITLRHKMEPSCWLCCPAQTKVSSKVEEIEVATVEIEKVRMRERTCELNVLPAWLPHQ